MGLTLFSRIVQIVGYVDDLNFIATFKRKLKEAFLALEETVNKLGLSVNEQKTKHMQVAAREKKKKTLKQASFGLNVLITFFTEIKIKIQYCQ